MREYRPKPSAPSNLAKTGFSINLRSKTIIEPIKAQLTSFANFIFSFIKVPFHIWYN